VVTPRTAAASEVSALAALVASAVEDPELPPLTIGDLGIVRAVELGAEGEVSVVLTPTYTGCPATEVIGRDVRAALDRAGLDQVRIELRLSPAWSTDMITDEGRRKLDGMGIVPPPCLAAAGPAQRVDLAVKCPQCGSRNTEELSRFGSTPCKALDRCRACGEPFERFKQL
jgi:ring-1,2-phenylacetyl-CoA epoxidase subunit PaaD